MVMTIFSRANANFKRDVLYPHTREEIKIDMGLDFKLCNAITFHRDAKIDVNVTNIQ